MKSAKEARQHWAAWYGGAHKIPARIRYLFTREYGEPFDAPPLRCVLHRSPQPCKYCAAEMRNGTYGEGVDLANGHDASVYWSIEHDKHFVLRAENEWTFSNTREGIIWGPPHVTPDTHAEWRLNNAPAAPWLPLPPGVTRHKALPAVCLELPSAACFMKGRGDE